MLLVAKEVMNVTSSLNACPGLSRQNRSSPPAGWNAPHMERPIGERSASIFLWRVLFRLNARACLVVYISIGGMTYEAMADNVPDDMDHVGAHDRPGAGRRGR